MSIVGVNGAGRCGGTHTAGIGSSRRAGAQSWGLGLDHTPRAALTDEAAPSTVDLDVHRGDSNLDDLDLGLGDGEPNVA